MGTREILKTNPLRCHKSRSPWSAHSFVPDSPSVPASGILNCPLARRERSESFPCTAPRSPKQSNATWAPVTANRTDMIGVRRSQQQRPTRTDRLIYSLSRSAAASSLCHPVSAVERRSDAITDTPPSQTRKSGKNGGARQKRFTFSKFENYLTNYTAWNDQNIFWYGIQNISSLYKNFLKRGFCSPFKSLPDERVSSLQCKLLSGERSIQKFGSKKRFLNISHCEQHKAHCELFRN